MRAKVGELAWMHFIVFGADGFTPLTGQAAACTDYLSYDGTAAPEVVTIIEIGVSGHYAASYTSLAVGSYDLDVFCPDGRVQSDSFEVELSDLDDLNTILVFLEQVQAGRWFIDSATTQMIFYQDDNITELMRFNLLDAAGNPIDLSRVLIFDKVRV